MKKVVFSLLLLTVLACEQNPSENPHQNNAVADAESSVAGKLSSGTRYGGNRVDEIYDAMIKEDKHLTTLEEKIQNSFTQAHKAINEKKAILEKSENYYREAQNLTGNFSDSLLKKNTNLLIEESQKKYDAKTSSLRKLISRLEKTNQTISDYYAVFKIRKTLPEIEKYQAQNPLTTKDLEKLIRQQNQLLNELQSLK